MFLGPLDYQTFKKLVIGPFIMLFPFHSILSLSSQ